MSKFCELSSSPYTGQCTRPVCVQMSPGILIVCLTKQVLPQKEFNPVIHATKIWTNVSHKGFAAQPYCIFIWVNRAKKIPTMYPSNHRLGQLEIFNFHCKLGKQTSSKFSTNKGKSFEGLEVVHPCYDENISDVTRSQKRRRYCTGQ